MPLGVQRGLPNQVESYCFDVLGEDEICSKYGLRDVILRVIAKDVQ